MTVPESMAQYSAPEWNDFPDLDLYMDQVISVLEKYLSPFSEDKTITPTMINNYVKQKMISPPENKKYSREQLTHLFMICILKRFMQLADISKLLGSLFEKRTPEEVYTLFAEELDRAVRSMFCSGEYRCAEDGDETVFALRCALGAFGAICYSRQAFLFAYEVREENKEPKEEEPKKKKK